MKIGVLTYHVDLNAGAMLQCYCTCSAIKELGHEPYIIDLYHFPGNPYGIKAIAGYIANSGSLIRQASLRKKLYPPYTKHYKNVDELRNDPPVLDAYCIGSDQVWNTKISGVNHMAYFLDFGDANVKRFSYASSIGNSGWMINDEDENKRIKRLFDSYTGLSVREQSAAAILEKEFGLKAQIVCDPVLLHKRLDDIIESNITTGEVSCLIFQRNKTILDALHVVGDYCGAPMRMVTSVVPIKGYRYTYFKDLHSWLKYMTGSVFNITDSFHATVVSLLYHKPFAVVYQENGLSSRISDLLSVAGLSDRIFFDIEEFKKSDKWKQPINWDDVDERLEQFRQVSWKYLNDTIEKIK